MIQKGEFFQNRAKSFDVKASGIAVKLGQLSTFRIVVFVASATGVVYFANERSAWGIFFTLLVFFPLFGWLVNLYNKTKRHLVYTRSLLSVNEDEVRRLRNDIAHLSPGTEFLSEAHPYVSDLDVFGKNSLFQLINRGATPSGQKKLAGWLSFPAQKQVVEVRQSAVSELAEKVDWRQSFEAYGRMNDPAKATPSLALEVLATKPAPVPKSFKWWAAVSIAISLTIYGLFAASVVTWHWLGLALVFNGAFLLALMRNMNEDYAKMQGLARQLVTYIDLFGCIEQEEFDHPHLATQRAMLLNNNQPASVAFKRLSAIVYQFDNRFNMVYQLLNSFLLLDFWLVRLAEKWFSEHVENIPKWLDAMAEIEAMNSLAGFAYANPQFVYPTIAATDFELKAAGLGHPLIPSQKRVINDFTLEGKGLLLITGSNMSGKSTFLRTVGVNVVLALSGAPVCASAMSISYLEVFTSMRTHDDLAESVSSFYAELKRLRQLLDLLETNAPVLYMLDEVLKGTNSQDRHIGTEALVRQLLKERAAGFISTHDLTLSELEKTTPLVTNYSFNSEVKGKELLFDYKLTHGPCKSFNASLLMKNIGIEIIP